MQTAVKHVPFTRLISKEDWKKRVSGDIVSRQANADGSGAVTVRFSNFTRDDYGTRFDPAGCDLSQYNRNPMVSYCHAMDEGIYSLPVGRGLPATFQAREDGLYMDIEFTPEDVFDFGALVGRLVRSGFLNMVSIGADPQREEIVTEANGQQTMVFRDWKLYDISFVPLGSNDDALVMQRAKKFSLGVGSLRSVEKELREATAKITDDKVQEVADKLAPEDQKVEVKPEPEVKPVDEAQVQVEATATGADEAEVNVTVPQGESEVRIRKVIKIRESADQIKHREYFGQWLKTGQLYRELLAKLYARVGETATGDEKADVERMCSLILPPTPIPPARVEATKPVAETRQLQAKDVQVLSAQLAGALAPAMRETLAQLVRSGTPIRKMPERLEQAAREITSRITSSPKSV